MSKSDQISEWLTQKFELSRGGSAHNVQPMEGLRGFAVFLVFLVHYVTLVKPWMSQSSSVLIILDALHAIGNAGVDLFFVLSGYLIYGSLIAKPQPFVGFMLRRVKRIYPAFLAVFTTYVALSFVMPTESKIPHSLFDGIVYVVQNLLLLPGLLQIEPLITVAWSLSYEMFYYLAIPLVVVFMRLRERSAMWRVYFFASIAALTAIYCAALGGHVRLIMFVSGILLCEAMDSRRLPTPPSILALLALFAGLAAMLIPEGGSSGATAKTVALFVCFFIVCLACFRDASAWLPRVFSWTPLRWLGNMSYSYYLLHGLALKAAFLVVAILIPVADFGPLFFWSLLPVMFFLTVPPAAALFIVVERPFSLAPPKLPRLAS